MTTTPPSNFKPTPGFEFPAEVGDTIDQKLRQGILQGKTNPASELRSVRPNRQQPVVVPELSPDPEAARQQQQTRPPIMAQTRQQPQQRPALAPEQTPPVAPNMKAIVDPPMAHVSTADYMPVSLPSRFAYYSFKDLYIKPFRIPHIAKLAKAADVDSMQLIAEVMSSVLMTPGGDQNIGFKLAVADFYSLMYWQRRASFPKQTMRITTMCANPKHHERVTKKEVGEGSLMTDSSHELSELKTVFLDQVPDPEVYHVMLEVQGQFHRVDLRPETIADAIEFLGDARYGDEEFQYVARIASYLDLDTAFPRDTRWTLQERIEAVQDHMSNEQALTVLEYSDLVDSFGVEEFVNVKCKECGHEQRTKLSINASSFLSPRF